MNCIKTDYTIYFAFVFVLFLPCSLISQTYVNQEWVKVHGAPDNIDWTSTITDDMGNIITTGNSVTTGEDANIYTVKYNSEGFLEWTREWNGPLNSTDFGTALTTDESGDIFVTGASYYSCDTTFDIVVIKYDSNGSLDWYTSFDGTGGNDIPIAITLDENGYVYITGTSEGINTGFDFITIKFDQDGSEVWNARYDYNGLMDVGGDIVVEDQIIIGDQLFHRKVVKL